GLRRGIHSDLLASEGAARERVDDALAPAGGTGRAQDRVVDLAGGSADPVAVPVVLQGERGRARSARDCVEVVRVADEGRARTGGDRDRGLRIVPGLPDLL